MDLRSDYPYWLLRQGIIRSYLLCRQAITALAGICAKLRMDGHFKKTPSFQFASYRKDKKNLEKEFEARRKIGFSIHWMDEKDILEKYGFSRPGGMLSEDGAEVDAYQLTHSLLKKCISRGLKVYDHTAITKIHHHKKGVELFTADNKKIKARKLVTACGYESQRYIPTQVQDMRSTYAIISEPHDQKG